MSESAIEDEVTTYENYRAEFADYSLGTEEELIGPDIVVAKDDPKLVAVVRNNEDGEVLVEVTKDLPIDGTKSYTIELRTTPTELTDAVGWARRRKALVHAIAAVERRTLTCDDWDFCHMEIRNERYSITPGEVKKTGRQATIGLPIGEIGVGRTDDQLRRGELHTHLTLPWYWHGFSTNDELIGFSARERVLFAVVLSAAVKLAEIVQTKGRRIATASAKDAWAVRPRTPPQELFDSSAEFVRETVLDVLLSMDAPPVRAADQIVPSTENWRLARNHIVAAKSLGGSYLPHSVIAHRSAALFEYRDPLGFPEAFGHAFWDKDESFL